MNLALAIHFVDGNGCARIFLHLLNNLSAWANNGTDKLFGNFDLHDAWNLGFKFGTWLCNGFGKLTKDVLAACLSLHQGLF